MTVAAPSPSVRLILPTALALVVLRGSSMPWITLRTFGGTERVYNLSDISGGIAVIMTVAVSVVIGGVIGIFKRTTGIVIMSLSVAALGWMAAISGMLLTLLWSLIPSINVAGLDLAKATLGQGSGVVVTVTASLALAFLVVRQLEPLRSYSPSTRVPVVPVLGLTPTVVIAMCMHSEWLTLSSSQSDVQALVAGDALYGSGLVVLSLWLSVGLWIGSVIVNQSLMIKIASALSIMVAFVVGIYAVFMFAGGRLLDWLVPAKLENWASVSMQSELYVVMVSVCLLMVISIVGLFPQTHQLQISVRERLGGRFRFYISDAIGCVIFAALVVSLFWQLI